jgi:hypothetical protein
VSWRVERYDESWGGWRPLPKAYDDDSPAEYTEESTAEEICDIVSEHSRYRYRVREVTS